MDAASGFHSFAAGQEASADHRERKDSAMTRHISVSFATTAILTLADIKAAVETFDRGDSNVFEALDAILVAIQAQRVAVIDPRYEHRQQDAA